MHKCLLKNSTWGMGNWLAENPILMKTQLSA